MARPTMTRGLIVLISSAVLAGMTASAPGGQVRSKKRTARAEAPRVEMKAYPPAPVVEEPTPPIPTLQVQPEPGAKGEVLARHREIAGLMTGGVEFIPEIRLARFAWVARQGLEIKGWHGFIVDTEAMPDGVLVTIRVSPVLPATARASGHTLERYAISNGTIRFIDASASDPQGPLVITIN